VPSKAAKIKALISYGIISRRKYGGATQGMLTIRIRATVGQKQSRNQGGYQPSWS